jgi:hypothetical protein
MSEGSRAIVMDPLLRRIRGEFVEMPGLRLTLDQAQRLWHLNEEICRGLLGALVDLEFLIRDSEGRYARLSDGASRTERRRMGKADLGSTRRKETA